METMIQALLRSGWMALLALIPFGVMAHTEPENSVESADASFYAAIASSPDSLDMLLSETFVYRTNAGTLIDKPRLIEHLKSGQTQVTQPVIRHERVVIEGPTAISWGKVSLRVLNAGSYIPVQADFFHVWTAGAGSWRLVFRESHTIPAPQTLLPER